MQSSIRPRLLFVSPVVPMLEGRGNAMRAGMHVLALSARFEITLALVNPTDEDLAAMPEEIAGACCQIATFSQDGLFAKVNDSLSSWRPKVVLRALWPIPSPIARWRAPLRDVAEFVKARQFQVIHCFRLHTASLVELAGSGAWPKTRWVLDLDDYESFARFRNARRLWRRNMAFSVIEWMEGVKYRLYESRLIPRFGTVYVCSKADKHQLAERFPHVAWRVVPNIVPPPAGEIGAPADGPFTFLFVGSLDYQPNREGIIFFCTQVLPRLRAATQRAFKVLIVGRNPDEVVRSLANAPDVDVVANPPKVGRFYGEASACIAPIFSGGGTRIKILEAFSYGLPVVSSTLGAEGIEAAAGSEIEIADTVDEFIHACIRLMSDEPYRRGIGEAGRTLYQRYFSPDVLQRIFGTLEFRAA